MRKISSILVLSATLLVAGTGCLKDKGFEDQQYGIQINEVKGVAFPQASISPVKVGITGQSDPLAIAGPYITLESVQPASGDIHIKLELDDNLVKAEELTLLPAGSYSLNTLEPVIKAGDSSFRNLQITLLNTDALDPLKTYGIGLKMTSVDQGLQLARNQKEVVIAIVIKNKYDGVYALKGHFLRTDIPSYTGPFEAEMELQTSGPVSVNMFWPAPDGPDKYAQPFAADGSLTYFSNVAPEITFNPTTNKVVSLKNITGTPSMTVYPGYDSHYDPVTKTIYLKYYYNASPANRVFTDTLVYVRPTK